MTILGALAIIQTVGVQFTAGHVAATTIAGALFGAAVAFITN